MAETQTEPTDRQMLDHYLSKLDQSIACLRMEIAKPEMGMDVTGTVADLLPVVAELFPPCDFFAGLDHCS